MHRQVKINDKTEQCFGVVMTPLSVLSLRNVPSDSIQELNYLGDITYSDIMLIFW